MAVHDKGNQNQQQQAAGNQQQQAQQQTSNAYAQQQQAFATPGLTGVNAVLARAGKAESTNSRAGDVLTALTRVGKIDHEAQRLNSATYDLIRFDRDQHRVGVGALLVATTLRAGGNVYVAVRPLLIENKQITLKPRIITLGNERFEVPTYIQDTLTADYWERIARHVRETVGVPTAVVMNSGYLEVPFDFDVSEKNNAVVSQLLIQSVNRNGDALSPYVGEVPFNLSQFKMANEILTARLDFSGTPSTDIFGNPKRSDITVFLNRSTPNHQNDSDPFYESDREFNRVSCYVNLEYAPAQAPTGYAQNVQDTQIFTPMIVVTDVTQAQWVEANTLELWWLGFSNAYRATTGTAFAGVFLPDLSKKEDPRDIGAITYLAPNIRQRTKTRTDTFTPQMFGELMYNFVRPNPIIAYDVNTVGENAAIDTIILMAASDGPQAEAANRLLIQSLNNLTNGKFSQNFDATKNRLFVLAGSDMHRGFYCDDRENRHDIRDLGTLEALNALDGNIGEFNAWYRTVCDQTIHPDLRMKQRLGYERQFLSNNLVVNGKYTRVILTGVAAVALDQAVQQAGVSVDVENVSTVYGTQRFVGNTNITQYAVAQQAQWHNGNSNQTSYGVGVVGAGYII